MSVTKCLWCGRNFTPSTTGGHAQRFCRLPCRRAYDAAGRRFVAEAIACGLLSLDQIRNGAPEACTLLPGPFSSGADHKKTVPASVAPPARLVEYGGRLWRPRPT